MESLSGLPVVPPMLVDELLRRLNADYISPFEEELLRKHGKLRHDISARAWANLYSEWQQRSIKEQVSCCLVDNCLVLDTPEGVTRIKFRKKQWRAMRHAIRKKQIELDVPDDILSREGFGDWAMVYFPGGLF
ncbi:hypothetical protein BJX62DRAFT_243449 [Aspergillus germanicus]